MKGKAPEVLTVKKKGFIAALAVIAIVVILALLFFAAVIFSDNKITLARCVVTDNGGLYMVYNDRPVYLVCDKDAEYNTGDKLLIIHDGAFAESYPEQTRAHFIVKIGSGSIEDIPPKAVEILIETGNYDISNMGGADGPQTIYSTVQLLEKLSNAEESSYRIGATLPGTDFSSVGKVLADEITQQWKTYEGMTPEQRMVSSKLWGIVSVPADSWKECEETVGFAVYNPLEKLDWLNKTGYFGMESVDPDMSAKHIQITANAQSADRQLKEISITAGYNMESVCITLTAILAADSGTFTTGSICKGYATYEQSAETAGSGIPVLVVTADKMNNTGYYNKDYLDPTAYWVKDNVFYALRVLGEEKDRLRIQNTLDRILAEV